MAVWSVTSQSSAVTSLKRVWQGDLVQNVDVLVQQPWPSVRNGLPKHLKCPTITLSSPSTTMVYKIHKQHIFMVLQEFP